MELLWFHALPPPPPSLVKMCPSHLSPTDVSRPPPPPAVHGGSEVLPCPKQFTFNHWLAPEQVTVTNPRRDRTNQSLASTETTGFQSWWVWVEFPAWKKHGAACDLQSNAHHHNSKRMFLAHAEVFMASWEAGKENQELQPVFWLTDWLFSRPHTDSALPFTWQERGFFVQLEQFTETLNPQCGSKMLWQIQGVSERSYSNDMTQKLWITLHSGQPHAHGLAALLFFVPPTQPSQDFTGLNQSLKG